MRTYTGTNSRRTGKAVALMALALAVAFALTGCSAVFDSAISGTVKDRSARETSSAQTGGIADAMVYAYDSVDAWNNAYDNWDGKSVFNDFSVPSAKTTTDGSFSISSLRWKTTKPVYGKDADSKTIYLLVFHKDYGLTKVEGRTVQSDKSNNFGIVYCDKVSVTKNLVVKFKDKDDNSTTATGADATITDTSGFSFQYSYCDGYSADGSDNVKATVSSITNGQATITVKYRQYNADGSEAAAPTVTVYGIQTDSDWSYGGSEKVQMTYSAQDKAYTNTSLYFTNDWNTVSVTVKLKDGATDDAVNDPIYFKWEYNNGDGDTIKSDTVTTSTGSATINVKFKKGMETPCTLTLTKFDDNEGGKDYWIWTKSSTDGTPMVSDPEPQILLPLTDDSNNPSVDVYFKKNYIRLGDGISGYIYTGSSGSSSDSGLGTTLDDGKTITLFDNEGNQIKTAVRTKAENVAPTSSQAIFYHGKFQGLGAGAELPVEYSNANSYDASVTLTIKRKDETVEPPVEKLVLTITVTTKGEGLSDYYKDMTTV